MNTRLTRRSFFSNKTLRHAVASILASVLGLGLLSSAAHAQPYPSKSIKLIIDDLIRKTKGTHCLILVLN